MKSSIDYRQWLDSLPPTKGLLKNEQILGRELLSKKGIPSNTDEAWRFSNLNRLNSFFSLPVKKKDCSKNLTSVLPTEEKGRERIIIDAKKGLIKNINFPKGIRQLNEEEIEANLGQVIKTSKIKNDLSVSLNQAASSELLALKINNNASEALEIIVPSVEKEGISTRVILIVGKGAKLDLLHVFIGNHHSVQNNLIEIKLEPEAELNHGLISMGEGLESSSICTLAVEQAERSTYSLNSLHYGWNFARFEPRVIQSEGDASTIIKGLQVTKSTEQIATHSLIRFEGPNGKLDQLQKAVASDSSHCIFNGSIKVPQIAQKTAAAQLSRNLILSKRAKIDTKPELEIVADDVRCTHGATVSQLQDEELFYLLSRGIDNTHANSLLLKGYYDEVLSNFSKSANKWNFIEKLIQDIKK